MRRGSRGGQACIQSGSGVTEWFCELLSFPFLGRKTYKNLALCGVGAAGKEKF